MKKTNANKDFTEQLLPRNRKEQFKFIFKNRKPLIFNIGLLFLLFSIPYIISILFRNNFTYNFYLLFQSGDLSEVEAGVSIIENIVVFSFISFVCIEIFIIILSAIFYIYKKLVFGEPIFLKEYIVKGLKNNFLSFLMISLVFGVFNIICSLFLRFIGLNIITLFAYLIFYLVIYPYLGGLLFYKSIYTSKFSESLANGLTLLKQGGIKGYLLLLGILFIPLVNNLLADLLIITSTISLIINVLYFLLFLPTYLLICYCYYMSIFDVKINKTNFPDYYLKGLHKPSEEEKEAIYHEK